MSNANQYEIKYTVDYSFMLMYTLTPDDKKTTVMKLKAKYPGRKAEVISIKRVKSFSMSDIEKILSDEA